MMSKTILFPAVFTVAAAVLAGCATTKEATLQELVREGRTDELKDRFATKYDINATDENGDSALHLAAEKNDTDLVNFLLANGADSSLKNYRSQTPLHVAVENRSFDSAKILAAIDDNLFARNGDGVTALEMGIWDNPAYRSLFITPESGAIQDAEGRTIVHYFVTMKDTDSIAECAAKGIPLSVPDSYGNTPLDLAFANLAEEENADKTPAPAPAEIADGAESADGQPPAPRIPEKGSVNVAATLILNGAERVKTDYEYFQTAVAERSPDRRFEDGQTPLHISTILGHSEVVKYLLENSANVNAQDLSGSTPLHEAVRYGRTEIARQLLDAGADVNAKDNLGKTPVLLALPEEKRSELYSLLLLYRADLSCKDMYGDTVLHTASMTGVPVEQLRVLVSNGADINARNKDGISPLALAIENNIPEHIRFYAENGADINSMDTNGNTPLILALNSKSIPVELVVNGANVNVHDSAGNTPLHVAIVNNAPLQKIQYILSLADDVNERNADGNSALYFAVIRNRQRVGELLLAKNADIFAANNQNYSPLRLALTAGGSVTEWLITSQTIRATDGSGNTALHYAAEWGLRDAIATLIQKGADPAARNANGETPLFSAVRADKSQIIGQLASGGCDVNARDNLGSTPLHTAIRWNAPEAAGALLALGADIDAQNTAGKSALSEAALSGKYTMAELLLQSGANPDTGDSAGRTVLMDAVRAGDADMVRLLLAGHANPQLQEIHGRNALHEAALAGNTEIIKMIRNSGGNPLSRDKQGETPFSLSVGKGAAVIQAVLGNDTTVADSDGNTPVHIAVRMNGSPELLEMLLDCGFPADSRNSSGYTPLAVAAENGSAVLVRALLENGANPFVAINKDGNNAAVIALSEQNDEILSDIVKYAGTVSDTQGNTILHYAARLSDAETVRRLLSFGLNVGVKNISGETPYAVAMRWQKPDNAALLQSKTADAK